MPGILMRRGQVLETLGVCSRTLTKMVESGVLREIRAYQGARARFVRAEVEGMDCGLRIADCGSEEEEKILQKVTKGTKKKKGR